MNRFKALYRSFRDVARDARGNVLLIFGLSLIPLTFATGMGIDYTFAMRLQTKLAAAADAAALSATTTPMLDQTMATACSAATAMFKQQASGLAGLTLDTTDLSQFKVVVSDTYVANGTPVSATCGSGDAALSSTKTPLSRSATVTFRGQSANTFGGLLGKPTLTVSGVSATKVSKSPYLNVHLVLDNSQSMGLASTQQDAVNLYNATLAQNGTGRGCTFGCHNVANADVNKAKGVSNEQLAQSKGITMRINVLNQASQDMISTAKTSEGSTSLYQFALYTFGKQLTLLSGLTTDLDSAKTAAGTLDLGNNDGSGTADTNLPDVLAQLSPAASNSSSMKIAIHGNGSSPANAQAFVFIITDGVRDTVSGPGCNVNLYSHCTSPIVQADCDAFKNNGVQIGIVYTTYLPIYADPTNAGNNPTSGPFQQDYKNLVIPFTNSIATNLKACASSGFYFEASDGPSIHAAMQKLFAKASQTTVITR